MEAETLDLTSDTCLKNSSKVWLSTHVFKAVNPSITLARVRVRVRVSLSADQTEWRWRLKL